MAYDIKLVKQLRDETQAGFADCKKAAEESNGDHAAALDWLRARGAARATKKAGAVAAEGSIKTYMEKDSAAIIELNAQTDFVALNDKFISALDTIVKAIFKDGGKAKTLEDALKIKVGSETIEEFTTKLTGTIGEKISLRRFAYVKKSAGQSLNQYLHANSRIGSIILLKGGNDELAKDIAMHAAAMRPQFISSDEVPADVVARETKIIEEQMAEDPSNAKKPAKILENIKAGKIKKALKDMVITEQPFVKEPKKTVGQLLKDNGAELVSMNRYEVGEGIVVETVSFEEEVKKQIGK